MINVLFLFSPTQRWRQPSRIQGKSAILGEPPGINDDDHCALVVVVTDEQNDQATPKIGSPPVTIYSGLISRDSGALKPPNKLLYRVWCIKNATTPWTWNLLQTPFVFGFFGFEIWLFLLVNLTIIPLEILRLFLLKFGWFCLIFYHTTN